MKCAYLICAFLADKNAKITLTDLSAHSSAT